MIHLRPHHGVCIANFVGRGYDESFVRNMQTVTSGLKEEPNQIVKLVSGEDVLCAKCPHCKAGCETIQKVVQLDAETLAACDLAAGQEIAWAEFKSLVKKQVFETGRFYEICRPCKWYDFCRGIVVMRDAMGR